MIVDDIGNQVHVLPRDIMGQSTFGLSMRLLKWFPMRLVDWFLLIMSWWILGNTARFGLDRPTVGPLELKNLSGKTPVLDVGALAKIKSGDIMVNLTHQYSKLFVDAFIFTFNMCVCVCVLFKSLNPFPYLCTFDFSLFFGSIYNH